MPIILYFTYGLLKSVVAAKRQEKGFESMTEVVREFGSPVSHQEYMIDTRLEHRGL